MNTQFTSDSNLFQDRQLLDTEPVNSWQRLTAGDEKAERFEGFLRGTLVVSLCCAVLLSALRLHPAAEQTDSVTLALPTVHLQHVIDHASVAVQAALP